MRRRKKSTPHAPREVARHTTGELLTGHCQADLRIGAPFRESRANKPHAEREEYMLYSPPGHLAGVGWGLGEGEGLAGLFGPDVPLLARGDFRPAGAVE